MEGHGHYLEKNSDMYYSFAKILIVIGVSLILIGGILLLLNQVGVGKLPGDIHVQKKNFKFHFPIVTCLVASIILSVLLSAIFSLV